MAASSRSTAPSSSPAARSSSVAGSTSPASSSSINSSIAGAKPGRAAEDAGCGHLDGRAQQRQSLGAGEPRSDLDRELAGEVLEQPGERGHRRPENWLAVGAEVALELGGVVGGGGEQDRVAAELLAE